MKYLNIIWFFKTAPSTQVLILGRKNEKSHVQLKLEASCSDTNMLVWCSAFHNGTNAIPTILYNGITLDHML